MPSSRSTRKPAANPQSKAAKKGVSKASAFKKNKPVELELPSGEVCLVKRVGMESLMVQGVFTDNLLPLINESMQKAKGAPPGSKPELSFKEEDILSNPKLLADVMDSQDRVCAMVVVDPPVKYHRRVVGKDDKGNDVWEPIPLSERDDEIVYTDDVDMLDKTHIFQFTVGGSADLATFREQSSESVAALSDGIGVQLPTE